MEHGSANKALRMRKNEKKIQQFGMVNDANKEISTRKSKTVVESINRKQIHIKMRILHSNIARQSKFYGKE